MSGKAKPENRREKRRRGSAVLLSTGLLLGALCLTGCTRSQMNYQIAEAIGTDGKYENNEPVETPRMKEERAAREQSEADEQNLTEVLQKAADQAAGYNYEDAIATLNTLSGSAAMDSRVQDARSQYEEGDSKLQAWDGDIPHLCFPLLIEDPSRAFESASSDTYKSTMVTTAEFKGILNSLYENNYILIDIHSIASLASAGDMELQTLRLPEGKKPIVLSQDDPGYLTVKNGDGIATGLTVDQDGAVKAKYTDSEGHDLTGDYDFIPILDSFIAEHPDFSFRGARGIVSVAGKNGVFGCRLSDTESSSDGQSSDSTAETSSNTSSGGASWTDDEKEIAEVSKALTAEGWSIACAGWSHSYMNDDSMSTDQFRQEMDTWMEKVGNLTGSADILFFPYGAEVSYPGDKLDYLLKNGFVYLCGLWGDTDYKEIGDGYMRMTRRFVDGYSLQNAPDYFSEFFKVTDIIDEDR